MTQNQPIYAILEENLESGENTIVKAFLKKEDAIAFIRKEIDALLEPYRQANEDETFDVDDDGDSVETEDLFKVSIKEIPLV